MFLILRAVTVDCSTDAVPKFRPTATLAPKFMSNRLARNAVVLFQRFAKSYSKLKHYSYYHINIPNRQFSSCSWPPKSNMDKCVFNGTADRYNGITVDSITEPCDTDQVTSKFDDSLNKWIEDGRRCIWFKVYIQDASWVPILANRGFHFHHARDDFVMMYRWLPDNDPNLPPASHTNLGAGGLVINDENKVLVVSEKFYEYPHWKLPGGYVNKGEDIVAAAIREVKEETGIDAEFETVVALRHTHKMMFGNSDVYIIVMLKPKSQEIHISEREINHCQWMDIEEYLNHPHVHEFNRSIVRTALDYKRRGIKIDAENKTYSFGHITRNITMIAITNL